MLNASAWPTVAKKYPWTPRDAGNIRSTVVRLSFPELFTPSVFKGKDGKADPNAKPRYGVRLMLPAGDTAALVVEGLHAAIRGKFGDACTISAPTSGGKPTVRVDYKGQDGKPARANLDWPLIDQGEELKDGYEPGSLYLAAYSQDKPAVVDTKMQPIADAGAVYAGCYAFVTIRPYWVKGWDRLAIGLQGVQKLIDGERFGGGALAAADQFDNVSDEFGSLALEGAAGGAGLLD